jgi:hypothetical protein
MLPACATSGGDLAYLMHSLQERVKGKEYSTMEKIWNKETRPFTMSPAQATVSVRTTG